MAQSLWRGKNLIKKLDVDNTKYIVMSGPQSFLNFPISAEKNSVYKISINLKKESGNGILFCNIYGNKNFDFPQKQICCNKQNWETYDFELETKDFPNTLPLTFRLWRGAKGTGSVGVQTIIVSYKETDKVEPKITVQDIIVCNSEVKKTQNNKKEINIEDCEFIKFFERNKTNKIKVLYLPLNSEEIQQTAVENAFVNLGTQLCSFDFMLCAGKLGIKETNELFIKLSSYFYPDLIHMQLQYSDVISPNTLAEIRKNLSRVYISNWTGDIRTSIVKYFIDTSKEIDLSLISSVGQLELYKSAGCENVDYWQIGYDEKKFFRLDDEKRSILNKKYNCDIVFCCNNFIGADFPGAELRKKVISIFQDYFKDKFSLYGAGHNYSKGNLNFFKQNEVYNSAKIILSINHFNDVELYFSDRQLVSMASGTLTLSKYIPGLEKYFENKKDLVWFNTEEEALELAKYYLDHPEEAEEIGKNGAKKVLEEHTYFCRVNELMNKINIKKQTDMSVVLGTFNRLLHLKDVIDKILNSISKRRIEIIINDAGSTDGTKEYLKNIMAKDDRIVVIWSKERTSIVKAYNECFKIAKGKYVTWLSDDMLVVNDALENMCDLMDTLDEKDMGAFLVKDEGRDFYLPCLYGTYAPVVACVNTNTLKKYNYWNLDYPFYACDNEISARFLRMGGKIIESSSKIIHKKVIDELREKNSVQFENLGSSDKFYLVHRRYGEETGELYPMINFIIRENVPNYLIKEKYDDIKNQYCNSKFYIMFCENVERNINLDDFTILDFDDKKGFDLVVEIHKNNSNIIFPDRYKGREKLEQFAEIRKNNFVKENKFVKFLDNNKNGRKVMFLGLSGEVGRVEGVEDAFIENGFNLCSFDFNKCFKTHKRKTDSMFKLLVDEFCPEVIHMQLQHSNTISPQTLKEIKEKHTNIKVSNWTGDVGLNINDYFVEVSKEIDFTLVCNVGQIKDYLLSGCKNVYYWQTGADPNVFYNMDDIRKQEMIKKYNNDIIFIGHHYEELEYPGKEIRKQIVDGLYNIYGNRFGIYGEGWGEKTRGRIGYFIQNEIYNSAEILLSINHFNDIELYFSNRQLTTMCSGVLTLSKYIPGLEKYFENKKDLVWFNDVQECFDLVEYYLNHKEEAKLIGEAGRQKILLNCTLSKRVKELFEIIK